MSKTKDNIVKHINEQHGKVVEVTKSDYTLDNGDVFEHTFDIEENITVEEFQQLLDNAKDTLTNMLNNIEENIIDNE